MKHIYITIISCLLFTIGNAQMPAYYNGIDFSSSNVVNDLTTLIQPHTQITYGQFDENIVAAQIRKTARYQELSDLVKSINNWNSKIITIEVGARRFVAKSMNSFLRSIGFSHKESSSVCKSISMIVARCSHHIFAQRNNTSWHKGPLLVPYKPDEPNNLKD